MNINKIGVVGMGFVGGAIINAYNEKNASDKLETYDVDMSKTPTCDSLDKLVNSVDMIYVCVPTPSNLDGSCNISIVETVVDSINDCATTPKVIVLKSTIPPLTTQRLQNLYPKHYIAFFPEFLTEANANDNYLNQDLMLCGFSDKFEPELIESILNEQVSVVKSLHTCLVSNSEHAEYFKYVANCFLAAKVSIANEFATIAKSLGLDWDYMTQILSHDGRMGATHWKVPGPDGKYGFGGTCFPKDLKALISLAKSVDVNIPVLEAVWERNITLDRPEKDWEELKGRSVTE